MPLWRLAMPQDGVEGLGVAGEAGDDGRYIPAGTSAAENPHMLRLAGQREGGAGYGDGGCFLPVTLPPGCWKEP